jgi:hypothetical protein
LIEEFIHLVGAFLERAVMGSIFGQLLNVRSAVPDKSSGQIGSPKSNSPRGGLNSISIKDRS